MNYGECVRGVLDNLGCVQKMGRVPLDTPDNVCWNGMHEYVRHVPAPDSAVGPYMGTSGTCRFFCLHADAYGHVS